MTDDNVVVVEQGSMEAQKIAKAMSSPTSADLFNALSNGPMSATALAEVSKLPLTTVKYHLENMLSADLIEVTDTRWSAKGREMKIYAVKDQVVLIAPKKKVDVRGIMERYGIAAGCFAVISALALAIPETIYGALGGSSTVPQHPGLKSIGFETTSDVSVSPMTITNDLAASSMPTWIHEAVMVFFLAGLLILCLMMVYELYSVRKDTV